MIDNACKINMHYIHISSSTHKC